MAVDYNRTEVVNNASRWAAINTELGKIQTALLDALSRSGGSPNALAATLDLADNDIINVGTISVDNLLVDGEEIPSLQDLADAYAGYLAALQAVVDDADTDLAAAIAAADASFTAYLATAAQSATDAQTAETGAEAAQAAAEAAAAALPTIQPGDAGKRLQVNVTEDGYDFVVPASELPVLTGDPSQQSKIVGTDATGTSYELQDGPETSAPTGYSNIGQYQVMRDSIPAFDLLITPLATSLNTQRSVGPTSSGEYFEMGALDDIPSTAKGIHLLAELVFESSAAGTTYFQIGAAKHGETVNMENYGGPAQALGEAFALRVVLPPIPIDPSEDRVFDIKYNTNGNVDVGNSTLTLTVAGYTY